MTREANRYLPEEDDDDILADRQVPVGRAWVIAAVVAGIILGVWMNG